MFSEIERDFGRELTDQEKIFIETATSYLLVPNKDKFRHLQEIETSKLKFSAISETSMQITIGEKFRIAQIKLVNQLGIIKSSVIFDLTRVTVDALKVAPNVMSHFESLPLKQKSIIFFGGGVRSTLAAEELIKITHKFMQVLIEEKTMFAVLTDGYKGNDTTTYPATRAPHDVSQLFGEIPIPRYMIVPRCGEGVCHQSIHASDFYGENWGEEAPALAQVAHGFVFIAPFNLLTELEIILALQQNKPALIIDPTQEDDIVNHQVAKCGYIYHHAGIRSYKNPETAARILSKYLITSENSPPSSSRALSLQQPKPSPHKNQFNILTYKWNVSKAIYKRDVGKLLTHAKASQASNAGKHSHQ